MTLARSAGERDSPRENACAAVELEHLQRELVIEEAPDGVALAALEASVGRSRPRAGRQVAAPAASSGPLDDAIWAVVNFAFDEPGSPYLVDAWQWLLDELHRSRSRRVRPSDEELIRLLQETDPARLDRERAAR